MSLRHTCVTACALLVALAGGARAAGDPIDRALDDALRGLEGLPTQTGILYDRVLPLSGLERLDGSVASPAIELETWLQAYDELRRAGGAASLPVETDELRARARSGGRPGEIALAVLECRYERIRRDALARGALVLRDGRLEPGVGTPFAPHRAFALAALAGRTYRGAQVRFALARSLWLGSDPGALRRLELDLDDGFGFRDATLDGALDARYATTGRKTLRARATHADGSVLVASAAFAVEALATPAPDDTLEITASQPYLGQPGTGRAFVRLAPGHVAITNPVVVVEGFDIDNTMGWDELYALLNDEGLADSLQADGFDAVVLDFTDATDYVQRNAFVVAELIQQVQAGIAPDATLAVVGASMGGLCSRHALAWMESQGIPHRVRAWISLDAPHAGANIPLGIQYWAQFFAAQSASAAYFRDRLNTPAARQMLVYHSTDPPSGTGQPDPLRAGLLADLAVAGDYPGLPRRVAVANGSGAQAGQGFQPGEQIIRYEYSSFFVDVTGNVWAVPDQASHLVFDGRIRIVFSETTQAVTVSGTAPYDNAPGGWRASMTQMDTTQAPYGDIVALHPHHAFIPTTSALALDTADLFYDVAGDPDPLALTPFDAVYFPLENQEHVDVTPENALWLRDEIRGGVVAVDPGGGARAGGPALAAPAPNPFVAATRIEFTLAERGAVDLRVFALDGREVRRLARAAYPAGRHELRWDGRDARGAAVPSGVYFLRLESGGTVRAHRMVRVR